jgi:hypothetical protein
MATTIARIQSTPGVASSRLYLGSFSSTGTANPAGYLNTGELWGNYGFQITEALAGWFIYGIFNSSLQQLAGGMIYLEDDTRVYFGFDPPSSVWSTWNNLDVATSTRASPADVTTQLTAQGLTSTRAGFLDRLDATISSRESDASASTRATTNQTEHDATQATLAGLNNLSIANVQTAMTNQGYTSGRGPLLDRLDVVLSTRQSESDAATRHTANLAQHTATQGTLSTILTNIASVPAAVWNYLTSAATTVGSLGKRIADNLDAAITTREAESAAATRATTNQTELDATHTTLASISVTLDAGDLTDIGNAVWNATTAAAVTAGTFGMLTKTNLDATISSRLSEANSASRQTVNIAEHDATQATLAGLNNLSIANVQTAMTNQGYTGVRGAYLDRLDVAVSTRQSESDALARYNDINTDVAAVATSVSGLNVQSATTAALIALGYTSTRAGKIDNLDNLTAAPPTVAAIADAVLDEALSGHMTAGTAGEAIKLARDQALIAATNTQP